MSVFNRFKTAWNAFMGCDLTMDDRLSMYGSHGYATRPDRTRRKIQNERSIITSVFNRIAVDAASVNVRHVRLNEKDKYEETINDGLNRVLSIEANIDQTGRAFIQDAVQSMIDEGCVALMVTDADVDPENTDSYTVLTARVAKIIEWRPTTIRVEVYNEREGKKVNKILEKRITPIVENPFYAIMNEPNSTLQRLLRVLNQLDKINDTLSSGKMDVIIQVPYLAKTEAKQRQAEDRRRSIEAQLTGSKYGIAYIDGSEKVIQLNRPVENNLWNQAQELKEDLFNQMGITMEILNGTADSKAMTNYYTRTIEPILNALTEEITRKWLSRTAQTQRQYIMYFRDPFKLAPISDIAEMADKFTRNEIMTSNEIRAEVGLPPSDDMRADELRNANINQKEDTSLLDKKPQLPFTNSKSADIFKNEEGGKVNERINQT